MKKLTPEHIIKLSAIIGLTVVLSLAIVFGFLAGETKLIIQILCGISVIILLGKGIKYLMDND